MVTNLSLILPCLPLFFPLTVYSCEEQEGRVFAWPRTFGVCPSLGPMISTLALGTVTILRSAGF